MTPSAAKPRVTLGSIGRILLLIGLALARPLEVCAQGTISPSPFQTVFNNSGTIVTNACVWTYTAGTSTPATTYTDSALSVANTNPIRSDAGGRFTAFLAPGSSYKFVYETSCVPPAHGTTLRSADNIAATPSSSVGVDVLGTAGEAISANQCTYLSDGSGSKTSGQWFKCDSTNTYSSTLLTVGIATAAISSANTGTIRIAGVVTGFSSLSVGASYFASTAGTITTTAPANRRFLGIADTTASIVLTSNPPLPTALASGTASTGTVLRGDQTWTPVSIQSCGRLTLTTNLPVTTADVTAATTLYYTPISGCNQVTVFASGALKTDTLTETSIAVPATTSTLYDVFAFDNAGAINIELLAWTNDTTRATAITLQNGFLAKSGDATRKYVGSMRTTTVSGQTEDSFAKRFVWNYANRVRRVLRVKDTTDSWTYTTATYRQANNAAANQLAVVIGVAEVALEAGVSGNFSNTLTGVSGDVSIGEDSTTTPATGVFTSFGQTGAAGQIMPTAAALRTYPAVGYHFYAWLELSTASGTTTWFGDNAGTITQTGIYGVIEG